MNFIECVPLGSRREAIKKLLTALTEMDHDDRKGILIIDSEYETRRVFIKTTGPAGRKFDRYFPSGGSSAADHLCLATPGPFLVLHHSTVRHVSV